MLIKVISLILLLCLSSCSRQTTLIRVPSSIAQEQSSCNSAIKSLMSSKVSWKDKVMDKIPFTKKSVESTSVETKEAIYSWIHDSNRTSEQIISLHKEFSSLPFSNEQFGKIISLYPSFPKTNKKKDELYLYLSYANSFHAKEKERVLDDLRFVKTGKSKKSKYYKKFKNSRKKFSKFEDKQYSKLVTELESEGKYSSEQVKRISRSKAVQARKEFENLSYACSAKVETTDNAVAGVRFQKFALVVTPISTASMFTYANREELMNSLEEDDNERLQTWMKKLGYEVVLMSTLNMILSKIMAEPTGSYFSKVWKGASSDLGLIKVDALIYDRIFAASDDALLKRFNTLKDSEDYQKMLVDLNEILSKENTYQNFKRNIYNSLASMLNLSTEKDELIDISKLSIEELEDPKARDAVLKAITMQMYEEDKNEKDDALATLIHTGNKGEDRLFFFTEVAPIYHSINVGVAALIYNTICMGKNNPAKAFRNAALIYAAWSFSYNLFEFSARQHQIGQ
ncbi:hypothetical protein [Halobacteriovorax sp. HLS]|uniref:hypothetical protein n=1 Tax=Halobacteriovorax sp. HLS TaxID=2234000 RepID=UPI000FDA86A8|nr:hypothetical protein [Halobacteriovorax sp. HLS]